MKPFAKITSVALLAALFSIGCQQTSCDDPVPSLAYDDFIWGADTAILVYSFKDCDGDIGLGPGDTYPPFDTGSYYHYNYRVNLYRLNNGAWDLLVDASDTSIIGLNSRITYLNDRAEDLVLEGKIEKHIGTFEDFFVPGDTIKFEVSLIDRSLNESVPAESDPIVIPGI